MGMDPEQHNDVSLYEDDVEVKDAINVLQAGGKNADGCPAAQSRSPGAASATSCWLLTCLLTTWNPSTASWQSS